MTYVNLHIPIVQNDTIDKVIPELENAQLKEPPAIAFSFDAIGWKILGGLLLASVLVLVIIMVRNYIKNKYRREAIRQIENTKNISLNEVLRILKTTAIQVYGRQSIGFLFGNEWLEFLEKTGKNIQLLKFESSISKSVYQDEPPNNDTVQEIILNSKKWIRTHAGKL